MFSTAYPVVWENEEVFNTPLSYPTYLIQFNFKYVDHYTLDLVNISGQCRLSKLETKQIKGPPKSTHIS